MVKVEIEEMKSGKLEWSINVPDGTTEKLMPESNMFQKVWKGLKGLIQSFVLKIQKFLEKAWNIAVYEPKKVVHCLKVGLALTLVSLFYYLRPLYDSVGGNAMWAVMTVVVVFEFTVGATLCKCINRATATFLAGSLGVGIQWIAEQSGERFEPVILGASVFLLASATTFSRFIPSVKARFDYGAMIFILTFSLVSISGYQVDEIVGMAQNRLSTIAIGTSLCILIGMLFCPIWAGSELHLLINRNLGKLADSLDGCFSEYFKDDDEETNDDEEEDRSTKMKGYKCVLNSKASEESMANFARWEPAHGRFSFRHPWKQYLKVGASMRNCAYCIEALNAALNSEIQAPDNIKKHLNEPCLTLSLYSSNVLKELATIMKTMTKSTKIDFEVAEMNFAVEQLQNAIRSLSTDLFSSSSSAESTPFMEVLPSATLASLLIEIAARIEGIVYEVDELADMADFMPATDQKPTQIQTLNMKPHDSDQKTHDLHDDHTMKTLSKG